MAVRQVDRVFAEGAMCVDDAKRLHDPVKGVELGDDD